MQGIEGLMPFPLICIYKSPSKHMYQCWRRYRLAAAAEKAR